MTDVPRAGGPLDGRTVAVLMESDFVEYEVHYYLRRFAEEGARVELLTRLWGQPSLTFAGHELREPMEVRGDLEAVDDTRLAGYAALVVPGGMVSDRLRYTEDLAVPAPAVALLRRAFALPGLLKGVICHGLWLATPVPEVLRARRVTAHNNIVADVRNAGAATVDQDVVVDRDLVTARTAGHCHLFARALIDLLAAGGVAGAPEPTAAPAWADESQPGAPSRPPRPRPHPRVPDRAARHDGHRARDRRTT